MKVWVIEQGEYSDYRVIGVFSTEANAKLYMSKLDAKWDIPSIAEWDLDPCIEDLNAGRDNYRINFNSAGEIQRIEVATELCSFEELHWDIGHFYAVWAKDKEHAIKIASDKLFQYKAEHHGS